METLFFTLHSTAHDELGHVTSYFLSVLSEKPVILIEMLEIHFARNCAATLKWRPLNIHREVLVAPRRRCFFALWRRRKFKRGLDRS